MCASEKRSHKGTQAALKFVIQSSQLLVGTLELTEFKGFKKMSFCLCSFYVTNKHLSNNHIQLKNTK